MNCKNAHSLLSAYLDDELTGIEMLEIREHLNVCGPCAEELQSVEGVKRLLSASPVPEPSADFENRLVTRVLSATSIPAEERKISALTLTGIAAASMLATMLLLNSLHREAPAISEQNDNIPSDLMRQERAFGASLDPMGGSPVVFRH